MGSRVIATKATSACDFVSSMRTIRSPRLTAAISLSVNPVVRLSSNAVSAGSPAEVETARRHAMATRSPRRYVLLSIIPFNWESTANNRNSSLSFALPLARDI
jgi:hypothetical protein